MLVMTKAWLYSATICGLLFFAPVGSATADTTLVIGIAADPTGFDPEAVLNNTSGFVMAFPALPKSGMYRPMV